MPHESQLQIDFTAWLGRLSAGVEKKYERRLADKDGDCDDESYCPECAEKQVEIEKLKPDGYTQIDGWNAAMESDSQPFCATCGVMLIISPTEYCIEQDIEWLSEAKEIDESNAASIHNWLTGMGDFQQEKHWPLIKKHAKRLMKAHGEPVPKSGTIRFRPSDALTEHDWYGFDPIWYIAYEDFARQIIKAGAPFEILNNTSGIGCDSFSPLCDEKDACTNLANLFRHAGSEWPAGKFLASIGVESQADLDKPIVLLDNRPERIGGALSVQGRRLKRPGPNECHPEALEVYRGKLKFQKHDLRWLYRVNYSYPHDSSSWYIELTQKKGQSLPAFFASIEPWIESVMEPDTEGPNSRLHRLRAWHSAHEALKRLFYFDYDGSDIKLTDAWKGIHLDVPGRIEILMKWMEEDRVKEAARLAEIDRPRRLGANH